MLFSEYGYRQIGVDTLTKKNHTHEGKFEIIQTLCDGGNMMIKDTLYPMNYGSVYFINAIDTHCSIPFDEKKYIRNKVILNSSFIKNLFSIINENELIETLFIKNGGLSITLTNDDAMTVDGLFKQINAGLSKSESTMKVMSLLFELIDICIKSSKSMPAINSDDKNSIMQAVLVYINNNIESEISLDDICVHAHFNKYYLCHEFKKLTNMTIMQYVKERRLSIAKKKLINTENTISDIAVSTGFKSFSYFSRFFKEQTGMTPYSFRKKHSQIKQ